MDFCKESDYYISLYMDDMMDETTKKNLKST